MNAFPRIAFVLLLPIFAAPSLAQDNPAAIKKRKDAHRPKMGYLENGAVKIGVDLNLGGAITYLSKSGTDDNLVNNWDWGRQIQMSHYSGPSPFRVEGKAVAKAWEKFGWNPVQAGDHFGNASKLIESQNDGKTLHVKCVPMQWSLENAPSECTFESWFELDGPTARIRCRLNATRADKTQYLAYDQELPALYLNGPYYRLYSYTGDKPFANGELTRIEKRPDEPKNFPWSRFLATENWAALVNDDGWGVGVWQPGCVSFLGGFAGKPGKGDTKDGPTGYIAPVRNEIIDHNIAFEYSYTLIVGKLDDIRKKAVALAGKPKPPAWKFAKDRQGWTIENAIDAGWPIDGAWDVSLEKPGVHLIGPMSCWWAEDASSLKIDATFPNSVKRLKVFWATLDKPRFTEEKSATIDVKPNSDFLSVKLSDFPKYDGAIVRIRIDPIGDVDKRARLLIKSISLSK